MNEPMQKYMKVGLIHFMAYPFAMSGEGDIVNTIKDVLKDDYFDAIEVTHIQDTQERKKAIKLLKESGAAYVYGAQPQLMRNKLNINHLVEEEREKAVVKMKSCIDEAYEMGAAGIGYLAGTYEEATKENSYKQLVKSTREICQYAKEKGNLPVNLEIFDYDIEKCSLVGPVAMAKRIAEDITNEYDNFGLMVDLSHITQLHSSINENIDPIIPYIKHAHMANSVLVKGEPAYGDQHPRFWFPNDTVKEEDLAYFIRKLMEIGYLSSENPNILSFEVKPWGDEDSEMVIANAKRFLNRAWALV